jgi:hypothetical protein
MPQLVVCPDCQTPCSIEEVHPGETIRCQKCQRILADEPVVEEDAGSPSAPGAEEVPVSTRKKSAKNTAGGALWILLGVGLVIVLSSLLIVGGLAYAWYTWVEVEPMSPKSSGEGRELQKMNPGMGGIPAKPEPRLEDAER